MTVSLHAVVVQCAEAEALARFWADVLGERVDNGRRRAHAAALDVRAGAGAAARQEPHPRRSASRTSTRPASRWTTLADPEGNLFDVAG